MYNRTNQPTEHLYDCGPEVRVYGDGSDGEPILYEMDAASLTDTLTAMVQGMRGPGGRCILWGVDKDKVPVWERDNDDVASEQLALWEETVSAYLTTANPSLG